MSLIAAKQPHKSQRQARARSFFTNDLVKWGLISTKE
jgi:hypothetical protein